MDEKKKQRLEAKGWRVGSVKEFLGLAPEESTYIELKLALGSALRERRKQRHLTQIDLAKLLGSSQSRVAKMEAGDSSVSLDLLVRSLLKLGVTTEHLAYIIAGKAYPGPDTPGAIHEARVDYEAGQDQSSTP